ncbi:formate dehydrogenase subunit delta [Halomonas sp. KAO]|uniref:formate dehydrogenase subunit delta n=1 Tax=Halomonas sp. KAO TaxID=2783858 RepID=UPI0018A0C5FF|nr:formate dehydrogenase subunit delta [Halomonas sp. KAO]MBF7054688.1 formate dehydrogenase subunit delta [Halomonas sp. KAO]
MSHEQDAQLVRMVNQIIANLTPGRDQDAAAAEVCAHLEKFWARPMKQSIIACLEKDDTGLSTLAKRSVRLLKTKDRL